MARRSPAPMSPIRYFTDEDVFGALAAQLRKTGIDAISAPEAGRLTESDISQLSWATEERRVLVSFNVSDFAALHTEWMQNGLEHAGIVVSKRIPIGTMLRGLIRLARSSTAEDAINKLVYLGKLA